MEALGLVVVMTMIVVAVAAIMIVVGMLIMWQLWCG